MPALREAAAEILDPDEPLREVLERAGAVPTRDDAITIVCELVKMTHRQPDFTRLAAAYGRVRRRHLAVH